MDDFINLLNVGVVARQPPLDGRQPLGQRAIQGDQLAQSNEGSHNHDVDLDGSVAVQNAGKHGDPVFGKNIGRPPKPHFQ